MSDSQNWPHVGLFLKQTYEGGYRYLDHCGELMVELESDLAFFPTEGVRPTGCKMFKPEQGLEVSVNSNELTIRQEGGEISIDEFSELAADVSKRVISKFEPTRIVSNGTALHLFRRYTSEESSLSAIKTHWGKYEETLSDKIGMICVTKGLDFTFSSGSYRLLTKVNPASIRRNPVPLEAAHFGDSSLKKEQIRRRNLAGERFPREMGYGLLCDLDLIEDTPPLDGLIKQFKELKRLKAAILELLP
ncbi:hypothetical protein BH09VER1_BH09VER1_27240 [soil metagenome]